MIAMKHKLSKINSAILKNEMTDEDSELIFYDLQNLEEVLMNINEILEEPGKYNNPLNEIKEMMSYVLVEKNTGIPEWDEEFENGIY